LGFCGGRGGGEVGDFFLDAFAQVGELFFLHKSQFVVWVQEVGRGLDSRRIRLRRCGCWMLERDEGELGGT
jgi:hypothetical protein